MTKISSQQMKNGLMLMAVLTIGILATSVLSFHPTDASATVQSSCTTHSSPRGVTVQGSTVYVAVTSGGYIDYVSTTNCNNQQLPGYSVGTDPTFIVAKSSTTLVYTKKANNMVSKYVIGTGQTNYSTGSGTEPDDITNDRTNTYQWFTEYPAGKIGKFSTSSGIVTTKIVPKPSPSSPTPNPEGITYDNNDFIYVADEKNKYVSKYDAIVDYWPWSCFVSEIPWFVEADGNDNYVWGTMFTPGSSPVSKLFRMDKTTCAYTMYTVCFGCSQPQTLALSSTRVFVAFYGSGHVATFDRASPSWYPKDSVASALGGITLDSNNQYWVTSQTGNKLYRGTQNNY